MYDKEKLLFLSHSNINPKIHLNKSKLHLNRNGYEKLGKNFANFIRNNYTWLTETNKKANIDVGGSSTSTTLNEKSGIDDEIVDHITNVDLKSCRIRNLNKIVVGHLNINSIRNMFDFLAHLVKGNINVLMISETKLDESYPPSQFFWMATVSPSVLIGMGMAVVFCFTLETIYHPNFYQLIKT